MYKIENLPQTIQIGYSGENLYRPIQFDCTAWMNDFPNATISIVYKRPDGVVYPVAVNVDQNAAIWVPSNRDLEVVGVGEIQAVLIDGNVVGKRKIIRVNVSRSLEAGPAPGEVEEGWIVDIVRAAGTAINAKNEAVTAASEAAKSVVDSKTYSESAETAKNAAESAKNDAVNAKTAAITAKSAAETAKTAAEKAKSEAESFKTRAESAKTAAETAQSGAETAKSSAETAKSAAETAKAAAETAKSGAETASSEATKSADKAKSEADRAASTANQIETVTASKKQEISNLALEKKQEIEQRTQESIERIEAAIPDVDQQLSSLKQDLKAISNDKATLIPAAEGFVFAEFHLVAGHSYRISAGRRATTVKTVTQPIIGSAVEIESFGALTANVPMVITPSQNADYIRFYFASGITGYVTVAELGTKLLQISDRVDEVDSKNAFSLLVNKCKKVLSVSSKTITGTGNIVVPNGYAINDDVYALIECDNFEIVDKTVVRCLFRQMNAAQTGSVQTCEFAHIFENYYYAKITVAANQGILSILHVLGSNSLNFKVVSFGVGGIAFKQPDESRTDFLPKVVKAQKAVAEDWHFPYIDLFDNLGGGNNHIIPGTAKTWTQGGAKDLTQKFVLMSDGTHPVYGHGITKMYGRIIANQLGIVSPTYTQNDPDTSTDYWNGKNILWLGTSIPAGSDPALGVVGDGTAYPYLVGEQLGANVVNLARGSSCVRINSSTGQYDGMTYNHFLRSLSRTLAEVDMIVNNWASIHAKITDAPATLPAADVEIMRNHSFETLLMPYLNGMNQMPDLFVLDHGHNDLRPVGVDMDNDILIQPSTENMNRGILAEDSFMTSNNYANLKLAMNNNLGGISKLNEFATSLDRNTFIGAMNFIITLILRYNPRARIVIVGDYD